MVQVVLAESYGTSISTFERPPIAPKMAANKVSKNNARCFSFVTEKQICSLIQECFSESRISLDPSHYDNNE
jgi:hypothetical protein